MENNQEANILSYKILFDTSGKLVREISGLPYECADKVFSGHDLKVIQTIIREGRTKIDKIHHQIENEINAIKN